MADPRPESESARGASTTGAGDASRRIVAHVIAGPLGVGKTTVLARLLGAKPPAENWVALLNEFTDAGIDEHPRLVVHACIDRKIQKSKRTLDT